MRKNHFFVLFISILFFLTGFFLLQKKPVPLKQERITIRDHTFIVEVADTDSLREKGLSGRKNLAPDTGMLFLFPKKGMYSFWMKDMLFPLDFIWISDDIVVDLTENIPPAQAGFLPTYAPKTSVDTVLEVNSGKIKEWDIKIGDVVQDTTN